jgi:hypothetical protein
MPDRRGFRDESLVQEVRLREVCVQGIGSFSATVLHDSGFHDFLKVRRKEKKAFLCMKTFQRTRLFDGLFLRNSGSLG